MTCCLARLDGHERAGLQFGVKVHGNRLNALNNLRGAQALNANANDGESHCPGNRENRVKIRIPRYHNAALAKRKSKNLFAGSR